MFGSQPGVLHAAQLVDIHGARFWDLTYELDSAPGQRKTGRIGVESAYENPQPGDRVLLHLVMGVLTKIEEGA
jgi:hypothetical protein